MRACVCAGAFVRVRAGTNARARAVGVTAASRAERPVLSSDAVGPGRGWARTRLGPDAVGPGRGWGGTWLGVRKRWARGAPVCGDTAPRRAIQASMDARSYVCPSAASTGSRITCGEV